VNSGKLSVFRVFWICTINEIIEEEEVPGTTLDDQKEVIGKFEFATAGVCFLGGQKRSEQKAIV